MSITALHSTAAVLSLAAASERERYAAWIWNQLDIPKMTWAHS